MAESPEDCQKFAQFMRSEMGDISELIGEFVSLENMASGTQLVEEYLDNHDQIQNWEKTESQNEFEEEVQMNVEELVGSSIRNVRDILTREMRNMTWLHSRWVGQGSKFAIEAKNFQRVQRSMDEEECESELSADNLQSKLINQPKVSAERVGLSFMMIVNEIPEQTCTNLQSQANPIGVTLLNEEGHREGLNEQLVANTIRDITE